MQGGVDSRALHHLFNEVIDNVVDEVIAGHAVQSMYCNRMPIMITDNGRGLIDSSKFQ